MEAFHDLRRSAVRAMVRGGVPEKVAREISGHRTRPMFHHYDISDSKDKRRALELARAWNESQAAENTPTSWISRREPPRRRGPSRHLGLRQVE